MNSNDIHEGLTQSWEVLTGVFDDERSKIIRYASFLLLFLGMVWAGFNYFQAERIANLEEEIEYDNSSEIASQNETYNKLIELAQTVGTMRRGGEAIAASIGGVSAMPFNIAGYNEMGLEDLDSPVIPQFDVIPDSAPASQKAEEQEPQRENIVVRALMLSSKNKYAVIDYAQERGHVIRQGEQLPGGTGRVVRITKDGITVRPTGSKKELTYTVVNMQTAKSR